MQRCSGDKGALTVVKDSDLLLIRAEKLRREARSVRREAMRLSLARDQQCMMDIANRLEVDARDLDTRAKRSLNA